MSSLGRNVFFSCRLPQRDGLWKDATGIFLKSPTSDATKSILSVHWLPVPHPSFPLFFGSFGDQTLHHERRQKRKRKKEGGGDNRGYLTPKLYLLGRPLALPLTPSTLVTCPERIALLPVRRKKRKKTHWPIYKRIRWRKKDSRRVFFLCQHSQPEGEDPLQGQYTTYMWADMICCLKQSSSKVDVSGMSSRWDALFPPWLKTDGRAPEEQAPRPSLVCGSHHNGSTQTRGE